MSRPSDSDRLTRRPWLENYPACVPHSLELCDGPAWSVLEHTAKTFPIQCGCCYYSQRLSWGEMHDAACRTAAALIELGVRPGDRVGLLLPNMPEYPIALNGIWMAGGIAVALSPLMVPEEVSDLIKATDCRTIICLDLLAPLVLHGECQPEHVLFTTLRDRLPGWQRLGYAFAKIRRLGFWPPSDGPNQHSFEDAIGAVTADGIAPYCGSSDDPAYILPTGGTTGRPKAVTLSHRNLVANASQLYHWAGGRVGTESMLAVLPFFHSYGLTTCLMTGVSLAATLIMHHRFIPRTVIQLIREHRPTIFPAVPMMLRRINELLRNDASGVSSLTYCVSGGAPLDDETASEFAGHTGAIVVEGYGLSEASPVTHTGPLDGSNRIGTIGLPLPGTDARIVDAADGTRSLDYGEVGELVVKGPQVMLGYWNDPTATAEILQGGWLHTGDLSVCDEDGFFRIVDRKKDLIITSGLNVYPNDVEESLRACPGLQDVAVIGVPDEVRGELVKAMVVPVPGSEFDYAEFSAWCDRHLAKHKRPRLVELVDGDLPRNFLGKVIRRELRSSTPKQQTDTEQVETELTIEV